MVKPLSRKAVCLILTVLFLVCISDFLVPRYMVGHDTEFHAIRMRELAESIKLYGEWNPAIFPNVYNYFGYGIPLFYPSTMIYPGALLIVLGVSVMAAYEIELCLIALAAILITFFSCLSITKDRLTATLTAVLYCGSAYFAADLVERAAVGELLGYAFFPLVLLGMYRSLFGDYRFNLPLLLGFYLTAVSHMLSLLMFSAMFAIFMLVNCRRYLKEPMRILSVALHAAGVFVLASHYLLPLIEQYANARFFSEWHFANFNPGEAAVRLQNIFLTTGETGYVYTPPIGLTMLGVILLWLFSDKKARTNLERLRNQCLFGGLLCILLSTRLFPYFALDGALNVIQFPWRFYLPGTMFLALAGAMVIRKLAEKRGWKPLAVTVCCLVLCAAQYLSVSIPAWFEREASADIHSAMVDDDSDLLMMDENYLNINTTKDYWYFRDPYVLWETDTGIENAEQGYGFYSFYFYGNEGKTTVFEFPRVYYYGYEAVLQDGTQLPVTPGEHGMVAVTVGPDIDRGQITVSYAKTPVQRFSPLLSAAGFLSLAICLIVRRRNRYVTLEQGGRPRIPAASAGG